MSRVPDAVLRRLNAVPGVPSLWCRFPLGSLETRVRYGIFERPHYAYGIYQAAMQARAQGQTAISVLEFGVSRGFGLLAMEAAAIEIGQATGIRVAVYGFDTGHGLPKPVDYRDLPHIWREGEYKMDEARLRKQLRGAELVLGNVVDTVPQWLGRRDVPPVGFAAFDLDYYSSTMQAFQLFDGPDATHLPRTYCYLDDISWPEFACQNEFVGEMAAVHDFNLKYEHRKICPINLLRNQRPVHAYWHDQMFVFHNFLHPHYCDSVVQTNGKPS